MGKETLNEWLGQTVVAICISEIPVKPVNTRGRYFTRVASANHCRFATQPLRHNVHIGRFKTPDMIIDDRQFTDTLFKVVEQSMKFIVSFYLINAIEKYGSGFIRIRRALKDYLEVQFDVQESQGGVMATFAQKQPESPDVGVNVGVNELLAYVQANRWSAGG